MLTTKKGYCIALVLCVLLISPAVLWGSTVYFDSEGNVVEKDRHEQIAAERGEALNQELRSGYPAEQASWKDPIQLRQRRIEQWKDMRSKYDPGSLPSKIEDSPGTQ
jgi:hypothetical protein